MTLLFPSSIYFPSKRGLMAVKSRREAVFWCAALASAADAVSGRQPLDGDV
jgi:hypothetical protein